ncbi:MAG: methyltransferase domain-containing protein [Rikenellaceae bacterium]
MLSIGKLPDILSDIPFRTVISTEVIEHLYYPRGLIDLAKLALKIGGGGRLIISTPYHGYLKNLLVALFNRMDYHFSALWNGGHIKFWSFKTISVLLRERGFENIEFKGIGHMYLLWKQMIVKADISKFDD